MKVLAIGAHFDDVELGCSGTLAKHVLNGDDVFIYVVTNSGYSNYAKKVLRDSSVAFKEGLRAAKIIGASLFCGNYECLELQYNNELIQCIEKVVVENKIDSVYTHWVDDTHQDHFAIGRATLNAARHVQKLLMYRSNWYSTTKQFSGNFYVDITPTVNIKIRAVKAHNSEYKRVGEKWLQFFLHQNQNSGMEIGVKYAEIFELVKYLTDRP